MQSNGSCFVCQVNFWVLPNSRKIQSFQMGPVTGVPWVPEPKIIKRKIKKDSFHLDFEALLPISFHLNFEALVPRVSLAGLFLLRCGTARGPSRANASIVHTLNLPCLSLLYEIRALITFF